MPNSMTITLFIIKPVRVFCTLMVRIVHLPLLRHNEVG